MIPAGPTSTEGDVFTDTDVLVLTEDLQDDQILGTVQVVNPFRTSPEQLAGR